MLLKDIFGKDKPIIGDIHLPPLPGSPRYSPSTNLEAITQFAINEAKAYTEGGMDAIILENYGDVPFYPDKVGPETVAMMTHIACHLADKISIPFGIQVLRNDPLAALSVATAVGGKFIRVNVLSEETVSEEGFVQSKAYDVHRFRKTIVADDVKILADIDLSPGFKPKQFDVVELAEALAYRGLADAIIISGGFSGREPELGHIERLKSDKLLRGIPILVGGGINKNNVQEFLKVCDGIIVATSLKADGVSTNPVDTERVKEFMKRVNEVR